MAFEGLSQLKPSYYSIQSLGYRSLETGKRKEKSCSYTLVSHLMFVTIGSTCCTDCPNLGLLLSSLSPHIAHNICCLCINISLAPAATLWRNESQQDRHSALLAFPDSAGFSQYPPERSEFSSSFSKLCLWRGFGGRSSLEHITGASDTPFSFCLLLTR